MCLRFVAGNEVAYGLRGGRAFERVHEALNSRWAGWLLRRLNRGHRMILHESGADIDSWAACETWFVPMPAHPSMADFLVERPFEGLVVDYYADVLCLQHPDDVAADMKRAGQTVSDEAWQWWYQPERQESLTRSLTAADVITTPWAGLVAPLARRFGKPVIHLPDTHPGETRDFRRAWTLVVAAVRRVHREGDARG